MTPQRITELALANGFKLKEQPDGSTALNPYVFDFVDAINEEAAKELAESEAWHKRTQFLLDDAQRQLGMIDKLVTHSGCGNTYARIAAELGAANRLVK